MKLQYQNVKGFEIKRRTFEGKTEPEKNNSSLTSKYMPSYKYWMRIDYDNYSSENCYPRKSDCVAAIERAENQAGSLV